MKAPNCWYQFIFNNCTLLKELKLKQKEVLIYVESVCVLQYLNSILKHKKLGSNHKKQAEILTISPTASGNSLKEKAQRHFELNTNTEVPDKTTLIQGSHKPIGMTWDAFIFFKLK